MLTQNPVQDQPPALQGQILTPNEILFSLLQSLPSIKSTSSSDTNLSVYSTEERRQRRMVSNRESSRRSRLKKKRHQEDLTSEVNRLKVGNQELKSCLCVVAHDCHLIQMDSNRLLSELIFLHNKLTGLHQILAPITMQLQ
ncbi:basic leucine-zipper 5 [Striga hermonthica]|uniref:Basic leucine-zipper 5 n=1 Tax=Striga hermonthica TaxID=68872 RepID=A0A9N7MN22_STRHE|nr:basic leucine-zipper 5 [Striga hermonthica]